VSYRLYIEDALSNPRKDTTKLLARAAKKDALLLQALILYLQEGQAPYVWRVANVIKVISRSAKKYIHPHLSGVFKAAVIRKEEDSVAGILFKILVHCKADLSSNAEIIDIAIYQILKPSEIGYNAGYGLQLLGLASKQYPELKEEFLLILKEVYPRLEKQYVINCANKLLKQLQG